MPTNSVGSDPNTAADTQAKPSSGMRGSRLSLARGVMRNLPKFAYLLPPIRAKSVQQLRERLGIPTRTHETQQPFNLSTRLGIRVRKLGLEQAVQNVSKNGFGHIPDLAPMDFTDQLRETVRRIASAQPDGRANMLLDKDPIFEEVVLNPKILALAEVMCGKGALLSRLVGCVIKQNPPVADLHVTQNRIPAPFPEHNQMVTFCWACDEQTKEAGAIKVVPGSQHHRRPPSPDEITAQKDAEAVKCAAGSVTFFDGSLWHSRWPRTLEGEQVLLYITYCRLALRPQESYDYLDSDWSTGKPFALRVLLGKEDGLDTAEGAIGSIDNLSKFLRMSNWSKT